MPYLSEQTNNRKKIWGIEILDYRNKPLFTGNVNTEKQLRKLISDNIPNKRTFVITIVKKVNKEEALVSERMMFSSNKDKLKQMDWRIDELLFSIEQAIKKYKLNKGGQNYE